MRRVSRIFAFGLLLALPACGSSDGTTGTQGSSLSGNWAGEFDNGIQITATLTQTGTAITGTFDTGDSNGTIAGSRSGTTFTFQLDATTGTQRTLSSPVLTNGNTITALWDDGAGQDGAMCLAKTPAVCP